MPIKGLLFIIYAAAFVGGLYSNEISTALKDFLTKRSDENKEEEKK
jgi:hypothetical protein